MSTELGSFLDAIDRFGPDVRRWPDAPRRAARHLLGRGDAAAAQALARAERDEALLRSALAIEPPPLLAGRIVARVRERRRASAWTSWLAALLPGDPVRAGAVAAAALVAGGILMGVLQQAEPDEETGAIVALLSPADLGADGD